MDHYRKEILKVELHRRRNLTGQPLYDVGDLAGKTQRTVGCKAYQSEFPAPT